MDLERPNDKTHKEIYYVISNKKGIVKDVRMMNSVITGSIHQIMRAKVELNTR